MLTIFKSFIERRGLSRYSLVGVAAVVLAIIGVFLYSRRAPGLTERNTILLTVFVNTTGD